MRIAVALGALSDFDELVDEFVSEVALVTGEVATPEQVASLTAGCDGLIVSLHRMDAPRIASMSDSVRVLGRAGVGLDSIDLVAAERRHLPVVYEPTYGTSEVADHACSMLLTLHRQLTAAHSLVGSRGWCTPADLGHVVSLQDATLGLVGCGRIGRAVVERMRPFVARMVSFDPTVDWMPPGVESADSVEDLLQASDLVTLHAPLTDQTFHLIDEQRLHLMRRHSILVNVSRGGLIDEDSLAQALRSGVIGGAGLDVYEVEPLSPASALRNAPNVLLTPHIAWYSRASAPRLARWTVRDCIEVLSGREPVHGALTGVAQ